MNTSISLKSSWKQLVAVVAVALFSVAMLLPATAADAARRPLPKKVKINHTYKKSKVTVKWKQKKGKKKIEIKYDGEVIAKKTALGKKTKIRFNENLFTHGESYKVRVKLKKRGDLKGSKWKIKTYVHEDRDFDNDFEENDVDTDDDNDGILDVDDTMPIDHDNDGIVDYEDDDDDNDTYPDDLDEFPNDHDNDGIDDFNDDDDDNDGILDVDEEDGQQFDEDNDGIIDSEDEDYEGYVPPEVDSDVVISVDGFDVQDITLAVGGKVRWTNQDTGNNHAVSGGDGSETDWNSGSIAFGQSYTHQFDTAGSYTYEVAFQSDSFQGTITVE